MSQTALKVAFAGTPEFAATALQAIIDGGFQVPLVLTQPDRPAGRGMKLQPSPVKQLALTHGLRIAQPERLRTETQRAELVDAVPDVLVVAAYGLILPQAVLDLPRFGCINIHASLLPRWRGAAPIHRAIEAGDAETGITIMQMDAGLDTGDILAMQALAIAPYDTTASLHDKLAQLGADMIVSTLRTLANHPPMARRQQPGEGITYASKIDKSEARLDWNQPASMLARRIRAFNPFPVATGWLNDVPLKIWRAEVVSRTGTPGQILEASDSELIVACGENALRLLELQKPGSRRMSVSEWRRGFVVTTADRFSLDA